MADGRWQMADGRWKGEWLSDLADVDVEKGERRETEFQRFIAAAGPPWRCILELSRGAPFSRCP